MLNNFPIRSVLVLFAAVSVSSCDQDPWREKTDQSYAGCLREAVTGSANLSVSDIRLLCAEASGVDDASYKYDEGKMTPGNEFTVCYDKEISTLRGLNVPNPERYARGVCRYPDPVEVGKTQSK